MRALGFKCGFKCGAVDPLQILSVPVRLSATSLSEVALKVWASPCTLSAIVGPASQTELSASAALALCVLWGSIHERNC